MDKKRASPCGNALSSFHLKWSSVPIDRSPPSSSWLGSRHCAVRNNTSHWPEYHGCLPSPHYNLSCTHSLSYVQSVRLHRRTSGLHHRLAVKQSLSPSCFQTGSVRSDTRQTLCCSS